MIDRKRDLPLATQARLLGMTRSTVCRKPEPVCAADLAVMRRIDELPLDCPFAGSRRLRSMLANAGIVMGRTHVRTLMRRMGIEALYRRPRTSRPGPGHKIYPYLLRDVAVTQPNQVWAADITHIPMARGFVYLVVVLDWFSRRALSWRVSITPEADFCVEAVEEALARHARPLQHRPGQSVHQRGVHRPAAGKRHQDQHGRQGRLAGQCGRRTALADDQIPGGLCPGLRHGC
jgi:putative transposase